MHNHQLIRELLTNYNFDPSKLFGKQFRTMRADVIEATTGTRPKYADQGYYKMMDHLYEAYSIHTYYTCQFNRDTQLREAISKP